VNSATQVKEIIEASKDQRNGIENINISIQELTGNINENSVSAEELSSSAEELSARAEELKELISLFKI